MMIDYSSRKVLVLYCGGTAGMLPTGPDGALAPAPLNELKKNIPELEQLPYQMEYREFYNEEGNLIDSSNADYPLYNSLAVEVGDAQDYYDGIVVIFGTDTMGPCAGAQGYLLDGLKKPLVLTGAMTPAYEKENDARENIIDSIHLAARSGYDIPLIPEPVICFHGNVVRGVQSYKYSTSPTDPNSFKSTDGQILAQIENGNITVNEDAILKPPTATERLIVRELPYKPFTIHPVYIDALGLQSDELLAQTGEYIATGDGALLLDGIARSDKRTITMLEKYAPSALPIFLTQHEPSPNPAWNNAGRTMDFQQAMIKAQYVMNLTRDPALIQRLFGANLRGELDGPIESESKIIAEYEREKMGPPIR